jgi:hypothetical protein
MLTSSILQILASSLEQLQPKPVEEVTDGFGAEMLAAAAREAAGDAKEQTVQSGEGSVKGFTSEDQPITTPLPGPSLEGLIQMVTKLQEGNQSRFVDVFE